MEVVEYRIKDPWTCRGSSNEDFFLFLNFIFFEYYIWWSISCLGSDSWWPVMTATREPSSVSLELWMKRTETERVGSTYRRMSPQQSVQKTIIYAQLGVSSPRSWTQFSSVDEFGYYAVPMGGFSGVALADTTGVPRRDMVCSPSATWRQTKTSDWESIQWRNTLMPFSWSYMNFFVHSVEKKHESLNFPFSYCLWKKFFSFTIESSYSILLIPN